MGGIGAVGKRLRCHAKTPSDRKDRKERMPIDFISDLPYNVGQMAKLDSLGQFEQLVLTAILSLREDAYGVTIHSKVQELARPKAVSLGAVYVLSLIHIWPAPPGWRRAGCPDPGSRSWPSRAAGTRATGA